MMIFIIINLSLLSFCITFPLFFWSRLNTRLKSDSKKFYLIIINLCAGIVVVSVLFSPINIFFKALIVFWKISLILVSKFHWKRSIDVPILFLMPMILGIFILVLLINSFHLSGLSSFLILCCGAILNLILSKISLK